MLCLIGVQWTDKDYSYRNNIYDHRDSSWDKSQMAKNGQMVHVQYLFSDIVQWSQVSFVILKRTMSAYVLDTLDYIKVL